MPRFTASLPAFCLAALATLLLPLIFTRPVAAQDQGDGGVIYAPPVAAPVIEPFRAPSHPYGPGNRGLEYTTGAGQPVGASAHGEVVFAGQVGGALHVTVLHADGIRTSYSFLAEIEVTVGRRLHRGDRLGVTGERNFHFGARTGDVYIDPAALFAGRRVEVELLPIDVPPGRAPREEAWPKRREGARGVPLSSLP